MNAATTSVWSLDINFGIYAFYCDKRSTCTIHDSVIQGAVNGLFVQGKSSADGLGATSIRDSLDSGVVVAGASSLFPYPDEAGTVLPEISGNGFSGLAVYNNSYVRSNGALFDNNFVGIYITQEAMVQLLGSGNPSAAVQNSGAGCP